MSQSNVSASAIAVGRVTRELEARSCIYIEMISAGAVGPVTQEQEFFVVGTAAPIARHELPCALRPNVDTTFSRLHDYSDYSE